MSDDLSQYMQGSYEWTITITEPPLSCLKRQLISGSQIPLAVKIPYQLLKICHENVQEGYDYIDFLNATVPRASFRVRIQGRLERETPGAIASKIQANER